jgi:hypothetical protein
LAKNDQKPQPTPGESPQPTPGQDQSAQADAQAEPGQMTPPEAKALLDSVKKDEHVLPSAPDARINNQAQPDQPYKDW